MNIRYLSSEQARGRFEWINRCIPDVLLTVSEQMLGEQTGTCDED